MLTLVGVIGALGIGGFYIYKKKPEKMNVLVEKYKTSKNKKESLELLGNLDKLFILINSELNTHVKSENRLLELLVLKKIVSELKVKLIDNEKLLIELYNLSLLDKLSKGRVFLSLYDEGKSNVTMTEFLINGLLKLNHLVDVLKEREEKLLNYLEEEEKRLYDNVLQTMSIELEREENKTNYSDDYLKMRKELMDGLLARYNVNNSEKD